MNNSNVNLPLVSVVTLSYKQFNGIYRTISSVLSQNYPKIEYIISDDGSSNFPHQKIEQYIASSNTSYNVKILHDDTNVGTVKNINRAYKVATGEYVVNLSAGDVFFSNDVIRRIVTEFQSNKHNLLATSRIVYRDDLEPVCLLPHHASRRRIESWGNAEQYRAFITSTFLDMASGSALAFRRAMVEELGFFDEKYVLWEDGPIIDKYLRSGRVIGTAYDIISIWYESTGVSSVGVNPLLREDTLLFNHTDKLLNIDSFSKWDQMKIRYRNKSYDSPGSVSRMLLKVTCFPIFLFYLMHSVTLSVYSRRDKAILRRLMAKERLRQ